MPEIGLQLLGRFRLEGATQPGPKARALLAYLACQPGRAASRDRLAALIWDRTGERHALRQCLFELRQRLGPAAHFVFRCESEAVALAPSLATDVDGFEAAMARGDPAAACALLRGPFCDGLDPRSEPFDAWLAVERRRREERAAAALAELAREAESRGADHTALAAARALAELDPFDDAAQARLIALYRRRGCSGAARLAHRHCVARFHRELGVAPGPEVQAAARTPLPHPDPAPPLPVPPGGPARRFPVVLVFAAAMAAFTFVALGTGTGPAGSSPGPWIDASEWPSDPVLDTRGLPVAEAVSRAIGGDPDFAHLFPAGC